VSGRHWTFLVPRPSFFWLGYLSIVYLFIGCQQEGKEKSFVTTVAYQMETADRLLILVVSTGCKRLHSNLTCDKFC
jgi:hypothetical protein